MANNCLFTYFADIEQLLDSFESNVTVNQLVLGLTSSVKWELENVVIIVVRVNQISSALNISDKAETLS